MAVFSALVGGSDSDANTRRSEEAAKRSAKVQEDALAFAKEQFKLFRPIIKNTTRFFSNIPIDDIVSGRVLSKRAEFLSAQADRAGQDRLRRVDAELARRGISNDAAGQIFRSQVGRDVDQQKNAIRAADIDNTMNRLFDLSRVGVNQGQFTTSSGIQASKILSNQALGFEQIATQERINSSNIGAEILGTAASFIPSPGGK